MSRWLRRGLHVVMSTILVVAILGLGADTAHAQPIEDQFTDPGPWPSIGYDNGNTGQCDPNVAPSQDHTFVYSAGIGFGGSDHPIVVFGVGTNVGGVADPVCQYEGMLEHLASWGFVVVSPNDGNVGDGVAMLDAVNEIVSLNDDMSSPFHDKLDTSNIATFGHSQGAGGAVNAAIDSNGLVTSVLTWGFPDPLWWGTPFPDMSDVDVPVFFIRGSDFWEDIISPESTNQTVFNAVTGPAAKATVCGDEWDLPGNDCADGDGAAHLNMTNAIGYSTAWLMYTLADGAFDSDDVFVGSTPEIATNGGWENWQSKSLS